LALHRDTQKDTFRKRFWLPIGVFLLRAYLAQVEMPWYTGADINSMGLETWLMFYQTRWAEFDSKIFR